VTAELFHAGGRQNVKKLTVAFRDFSNAPEKPVGLFFTQFYAHLRWVRHSILPSHSLITHSMQLSPS
jgi:hypothetical protein